MRKQKQILEVTTEVTSKLYKSCSLRNILRWQGRVVTPLPIPNREVKHTIADGTAPPGGRVGSCRFSKPLTRNGRGLFVYL